MVAGVGAYRLTSHLDIAFFEFKQSTKIADLGAIMGDSGLVLFFGIFIGSIVLFIYALCKWAEWSSRKNEKSRSRSIIFLICIVCVSILLFLFMTASCSIILSSQYHESNETESPIIISSPPPQISRNPHRFPFSTSIYGLPRNQPIIEAYGVFGMILLVDDGEKSQIICRAMLRYFERDAYQKTVERDGMRFDVRPVYWPSLVGKDVLDDKACNHLARYYDFDRARAMRAALKLPAQPFFVIAGFTKDAPIKYLRVSVWNLSRVPEDEVSDSLDAYMAYYRAPSMGHEMITASTRQRAKSFVLDMSRPLSKLFGIEEAKAAE